MQFLFLCDPQKSGFLWTYTTFAGITQKIQNTFHWLELTIEILSFLKISSLKDILPLWTSAKKSSSKDRIEIIPKGIFWPKNLTISIFFLWIIQNVDLVWELRESTLKSSRISIHSMITFKNLKRQVTCIRAVKLHVSFLQIILFNKN